MSVGRIEMVDGIKKFVPYADSGGGNNPESEYVYIERFIKTEKLLSDWKLGSGPGSSCYTEIGAKMYDAVTGVYLRKINSESVASIVKFVPLSFGVLPYYKADVDYYYFTTKQIINSSFFAYMGINVDLTQGMFWFTNQKKLTESPFLTWYKTYISSATATESSLIERYPAFLFRGYLKKLETDDPMYIKFGTKTLDEAESNLH